LQIFFYRMLNRFTTVLFLACITLWNCSSEYNNPGGIIPPEDLLNAVHTDSTTITAFFEREDTIRTDGSDRGLLGSYFDPVFGRTTAGFYTTLNVLQKFKPGLTPIVDSVVLCLRHDGDYGDVTKFNGYQVAEVFEVAQEIPIPDTSSDGYTAYSSFPLHPVPLAVQGFAPKYFAYKNEGTQLRIRMNNSFGERFLNQDSLMPGSIDNICKGLYVRISPQITQSQAPGQGAISYFRLTNDLSRVSVYYHTSTATSAELRLVTSGSGNVHFNVFGHDYVSSVEPTFYSRLLDSTISGPNLYMQSLGGLRLKLKFPHLMNYVDTQKVILHKAELIIPVDIGQDLSKYPVAPNILPYVITSEGLIRVFDDFPYGYYDSYYDATNRQFRVVITQYLQDVLTGQVSNSGIYLKLSGGFYDQYRPLLVDATAAYRAVISSPEHPTLPMKLNLTYTPVYTQ